MAIKAFRRSKLKNIINLLNVSVAVKFSGRSKVCEYFGSFIIAIPSQINWNKVVIIVSISFFSTKFITAYIKQPKSMNCLKSKIGQNGRQCWNLKK
jgi:hypothetical protein